VNRLRDELLPSSRFSLDQDGAIRWRDSFDVLNNGPKVRAGTNQFRSQHRSLLEPSALDGMLVTGWAIMILVTIDVFACLHIPYAGSDFVISADAKR
jgi:hypothetical protein